MERTPPQTESARERGYDSPEIENLGKSGELEQDAGDIADEGPGASGLMATFQSAEMVTVRPVTDRAVPIRRLDMPDTWLYEKGDSAVRIVRTGTLVFEVFGPGEYREHHSFENDNELAKFLQRTEEQLTSSGFNPRGYNADRRAADQPQLHMDRRRSSAA